MERQGRLHRIIEHGDLPGLGDDDHPQYIKDSEFTQNSGFLVGTGAGTFQEETGAMLRTSIGVGTGDSPTFTGLTLSGLTATRVLFAGVGGVISDDAGFTFASGVLTASTFNATDEDNVLQIDGSVAFRTGVSANDNLFIGISSFEKTEGTGNIGIGANAGRYNDTSAGAGINNIYIGSSAGRGISDGNSNKSKQNIGIGARALLFAKSGGLNVAIGIDALAGVGDGQRNIAIGREAIKTGTGSFNIAIGEGTLKTSSAAFNENIAIGRNALGQSSGNSNIAIGYNVGVHQTTNSNILIIDNQDRGSAALELTNSLLYGVFHATPASQSLRFNLGTFVLGNPTHSDADGGGAIQQQFIREQSGGEASIAAQIEVSHDGAADDQLGRIVRYVNTGAGLVARERLSSTGLKVGDGLAASAILHLIAGTATAGTAPLKFTSGTDLTAPEAGVIEYDGSHFSVTEVIDRRVLSVASDSITTAVTVVDTTDETTVFTAPISAAELHTGKVLRIFFYGQLSTHDANDALTIRIKIGGTLLTSLTSTPKQVTNTAFHGWDVITIRTTGAGGTFASHGHILIESTSVHENDQDVAVDTTGANDITVTFQWDSADAANTATLDQCFLEVLV